MSRRSIFIGTALLSACTLQRSSSPSGTSAQPSRSLSSSPSLASSQSAAGNIGTPMDLAMNDHMAHMNATDLVPGRTNPNASVQDRPGLPASAIGAPGRLERSPRHSEWVKIAWEPGSADSLMAWIVYPASANAQAKAPVVVVVHEIFGLQTWVRGVADQVAADGFIAIAPDILSRVRGGPSTVELPGQEAVALIRGVNSAERNKAINAAANYAMMLSSAEQKYAVIGYCWGGQTTFYHAINGGLKGFSAGVAFYGTPYTKPGTPATATTAAVPGAYDADSLAKIKVPVMLLSGSKDARIGSSMPALDSMMKSLGKTYSGTNYEGATHGFLRAQDDPKTCQANASECPRDEAEERANVAATKDAWPKTIAFLKKNLGVR